MPLIYDPEGKLSIDLPLSDKQRALLEEGAELTINYHTPQLLLGLLGANNGHISVRRQKDGRILCTGDPEAFRKFRVLRDAMAAAEKMRESE